MMAIDKSSFIILDEIRDYIIPPTRDELFYLEKSIIEQGCRDSLIVWQKNEKEFVIVDGHNRYEICQRHNIPFNFKVIPFVDIEQIKLWMIENQIGRRNLTPDQLSYFRGLKYLSLKKKKGGFENIKAKGKIDNSTSLLLSKEFNVSASTIKRDSKYAEGLNMVGNINPNLKMKILIGELKPRKTEIHALSITKNLEKMLIKLEKDRFEKPKHGISLKLATEEDRLRKIKGMIISTISRVINNRNQKDIGELKLLITELENELFHEKGKKLFPIP